MRIGIDAHFLERGACGNHTYTDSLLSAMAAADEQNDYVLYHLSESRPGLTLPFKRLQWRRIQPKLAPLRLAYGFPRQLSLDRPDVVHFQYHSPLIKLAKTVVTVHDVSFARIPHLYPFAQRLPIFASVGFAVSRADVIVAGSEHARKEIIDLYRCSPEKVVVVSYGARSDLQPVNDAGHIAEVRSRYGLHEEFALYVGRLEPRKNLVRLLHAFANLKRRLSSPAQLAIVGRNAFGYHDVYAEVESLGLAGDVVFTGAVPDADLPALYSAARLFVYPSLYEGFGLPLVEAMQCGTPVVAANQTSLPEVAGDAGLLVDPHDEAAIEEAMYSLFSNDCLHQQLREKGLARVKEFSWQNAAGKMIEIFQRTAGKTADGWADANGKEVRVTG